MLTTAHRDHIPEHCDDDNLFAACQGCHLAYDEEHHRQTRQRVLREATENEMYPLFDLFEHTTHIEP